MFFHYPSCLKFTATSILFGFYKYAHNNLHNEEVRVIDIESNRTEEILHASAGSIQTIDEIPIFTSNDNLEKEKKWKKL